ncbi:MAG: outer membrane protein transport protein [Bacteroidetes bacterium]|nr:outer membrane protein transport protein [Bacteroidota bacterium]
MNKRVTLSAVLCILLTLPPAEAFAGGFQLNEHGARSMAQASAFAARANDPSAIFFNPAGLSFQRGAQIMAGATLIAPSYSYYGPSNLNSNEQWDMKNNLFYPPNVYLTNTWTDGMLKGLAIGIGLTTPFGLGTEWDDDWIGRSVTREIELQTFYVMPTISYAFNDWFSVGVGANVVFSSVMLRRAVTNFDPVLNLELEGSGDIAFSWNAGIILKPVEDISFGFTYRAETQVDFEGEADFHPPATLAALFPGGDVTTGIALPATWFAGIAWAVTEDFDVEFDLQGIGWSSYDKLALDFAVDAENTPGVSQTDVSSPKDYEDTFIARLGAEYRIPLSGIAIRAGYFYDSNPVPDKSLEPLLPDSDRHGLNIGIGLDVIPNIRLDAAYLHMIILDRVTEATSYPGGVYMDGMYTGSADLFAFNITYVF